MLTLEYLIQDIRNIIEVTLNEMNNWKQFDLTEILKTKEILKKCELEIIESNDPNFVSFASPILSVSGELQYFKITYKKNLDENSLIYGISDDVIFTYDYMKLGKPAAKYILGKEERLAKRKAFVNFGLIKISAELVSSMENAKLADEARRFWIVDVLNRKNENFIKTFRESKITVKYLPFLFIEEEIGTERTLTFANEYPTRKEIINKWDETSPITFNLAEGQLLERLKALKTWPYKKAPVIDLAYR